MKGKFKVSGGSGFDRIDLSKLAPAGGDSALAEVDATQANELQRLAAKKLEGPTNGVGEAPVAEAVAARQVGAPFDGFMKVRSFEVDVKRPGVEGVETVQIPVCVNGPGHNCSMAAPIALDSTGQPSLVLKAGDTRAARTLRGESYVKIGMIGGRWDSVGADPEKIGLGEISEEIGATLVPGGFISLGDKLVPTMPSESTEADRYFAAIVRLNPGATPEGDGSEMEVTGLMGPKAMSVSQALTAIDDGSVGEGARARVAYSRALDSIGYIPELGRYIHDLPPALRKRFSTLGLGNPTDPRKLSAPAVDKAVEAEESKAHSKALQVNDVQFVESKQIDVTTSAQFLDAKTTHVARSETGSETVGDPFPNQILHLTYDRVKVGMFYRDPVQGPMVQLMEAERPLMAAKGMVLDGERTYKDENTNLVAKDVLNLKVELGEAKGDEVSALVDSAVASSLAEQGLTGALGRLGAACDASPGQSDLRYHFFAVSVEKPADTRGFVPLADAVSLCRGGEGDAATEALLLRLATQEGWIPSLGCSVAQAQKMAG